MRVIELGKSTEERLIKALKALPTPYAYEEVAISLRKLIAANEKHNEDAAIKYLDALYRFAQQHAFLYEDWYDQELSYPIHVMWTVFRGMI